MIRAALCVDDKICCHAVHNRLDENVRRASDHRRFDHPACGISRDNAADLFSRFERNVYDISLACKNLIHAIVVIYIL